MTDQHHSYPAALAPEFTERHELVNHIVGEYVRGGVTTNSLESPFSLLKHGLIGQLHKLSGKHRYRYLAEFEYRFNHRTDADVAVECIPDEDDRHVLAAAIRARANTIVTQNTKHFPKNCFDPFGVLCQTADDFLVHQYHLGPQLVLDKLDDQGREFSQDRAFVIAT